MNRTLRVASRNAGKLRELRELLAPYGYAVCGIDDLDHLALLEEGDSFEANALGKAESVLRATGESTLADDSGLEVDALAGAPGIHSARFSGATSGNIDAQNRAHLLGLLDNVPPPQRTARFVCVLAYCVPNAPPRFFRGQLEGRITAHERGTGGFGYDSIFELPQDGRTLAQMTSVEKNAVSHRGRALAAFAASLQG